MTNDSYIVLSPSELLEKCLIAINKINEIRGKKVSDLYNGWVENENKRWCRRRSWWRKPLVNVEDAKRWHIKHENSIWCGDFWYKWARYWRDTQYQIALELKELAESMMDKDDAPYRSPDKRSKMIQVSHSNWNALDI